MDKTLPLTLQKFYSKYPRIVGISIENNINLKSFIYFNIKL